MDLQVTNDGNGKTSGKRVAGFIGLFFMGTISMIAVIHTPSLIGQIIWPWGVVVGGLFGISVMEKMKT